MYRGIFDSSQKVVIPACPESAVLCNALKKIEKKIPDKPE